MIPLLKQFFFDETAFIRFFRAGLFAAGAIVQQLDPNSVPAWLGIALMAGSFLFTAGQPNPNLKEDLKEAKAKEG